MWERLAICYQQLRLVHYIERNCRNSVCLPTGLSEQRTMPLLIVIQSPASFISHSSFRIMRCRIVAVHTNVSLWLNVIWVWTIDLQQWVRWFYQYWRHWCAGSLWSHVGSIVSILRKFGSQGGTHVIANLRSSEVHCSEVAV